MKFNLARDLLLLRRVVRYQPYTAAHGQRASAWKSVAEEMRAAGVNVNWRACHLRCAFLLSERKKAHSAALSKPGPAAEVLERRALLDSITEAARTGVAPRNGRHPQRDGPAGSVMPFNPTFPLANGHVDDDVDDIDDDACSDSSGSRSAEPDLYRLYRLMHSDLRLRRSPARRMPRRERAHIADHRACTVRAHRSSDRSGRTRRRRWRQQAVIQQLSQLASIHQQQLGLLAALMSGGQAGPKPGIVAVPVPRCDAWQAQALPEQPRP